MLNIRKGVENGAAVFILGGRLDTTTAPDLEKAFQETLDSVDTLTLDCSDLDYVSSAGLRVLLSAEKKMSKKGGMKLTHVHEAVMDIFEVTGFIDILDIE